MNRKIIGFVMALTIFVLSESALAKFSRWYCIAGYSHVSHEAAVHALDVDPLCIATYCEIREATHCKTSWQYRWKEI